MICSSFAATTASSKKQLVEIPQTEEQKRAGMFFFDGSILPHQWSGRLSHRMRASADYNKGARSSVRHFCCAQTTRECRGGVDCITRRMFSFSVLLFELWNCAKIPITRSWVITGDDPGDAAPNLQGPCRFCETRAAGHRVFPRYSGNCVVRAIRGSSQAAVPHRGRAGPSWGRSL